MFDERAEEAPENPVSALVAEVSAGSVEAVDAAMWSLSDEQVAELVIEHEQAARRFAAVGLAIVRQAERCGTAKALGATSSSDWLRDVLCLAPAEAKARTALAAKLDVDAAALDCGDRVLAGYDAEVVAGARRTGYPGPGSTPRAADEAPDADRGRVRRSPLDLDAAAVEALAPWAGSLPCTAAGVRAGRVSLAQAAVIQRHLANLPAGLDPVTVADCEAFLATRALEHDPRVLGRIGARLVTTLTHRDATSATGDDHSDHDDGDDGSDGATGGLSSADKRRENAEARTYFSLIDEGDGTVRASGCFAEEAADVIRAALEPLAAPLPAIEGVKDARPHAKRQGHALVELCRRVLDAATLPGSRAARPHISITATVDDLAQAPGAAGGTSAWGTPVPPEVLARIACDAEITRIVTDNFGVALHVDSGTRTVTPKQWAALVARDRGCAFPGCARPAAWSQAHHMVPWAEGGPTTLANLVLVCTHHHASVHHHGWRVRIATDGHPEFIPPAWIDADRNPRRNTYHRIPTALSQPRRPEAEPPVGGHDQRSTPRSACQPRHDPH